MDIMSMLGGSPGDASGWQGGLAQPTQAITDLSAHVDGGEVGRFGHPSASPVSGTGSVNGAKATSHYAAGIVLASIIALWVLGLLVFKGSNH